MLEAVKGLLLKPKWGASNRRLQENKDWWLIDGSVHSKKRSERIAAFQEHEGFGVSAECGSQLGYLRDKVVRQGSKKEGGKGNEVIVVLAALPVPLPSRCLPLPVFLCACPFVRLSVPGFLNCLLLGSKWCTRLGEGCSPGNVRCCPVVLLKEIKCAWPQVIVMSTKAGSVGINLTSASRLVICDVSLAALFRPSCCC